MTNNDILRRVRYTFNYSDYKMSAIFALAELEVSRPQLCGWLKKEDEEGYQPCNDRMLATFLNGLIIEKRGRREGEQPKPESQLTNNLILRKLKIALNLTSEDMLAALKLANFRLSKHELSAFFRKPDHKHYRECKDQVLRNLLKGVQFQHRGVVKAKPVYEKAATTKKTDCSNGKPRKSEVKIKSTEKKSPRKPLTQANFKWPSQ